jgi:hypothetical protein
VGACVLSGLKRISALSAAPNSRQGFFVDYGVFRSARRVAPSVKTLFQKQKPPGRGAKLSVDWGPCLSKDRHPTAQAVRIRWRPHLEAPDRAIPNVSDAPCS